MNSPVFALFILLHFGISCNSANKVVNTPERAKSDHRGFVYPRDGLYLRESGRKGSKVIKLLPMGSEVEIIGKAEKKTTIDWQADYWYHVRAGDGEGWVFGAYLYHIKGRPTSSVEDIYELNGLYLILTSDNRFWLMVSNCEGGGVVEGHVRKIGTRLKLTVENAGPFSKNIELTNVGNSHLKVEEMISLPMHPDWPACGPYVGQTYVRKFSHGS